MTPSRACTIGDPCSLDVCLLALREQVLGLNGLAFKYLISMPQHPSQRKCRTRLAHNPIVCNDHHMNTTYSSITPTQHEYEGFWYISFEGDFYKGCKRCGGAGQYSHNGDHSRCYECDNTSAKLGEMFDNEAAAQKWCHGKALRKAASDRRKEAQRMEHVARMEQNQAALKAADAGVYDFLMAIDLGAVYTDYATPEAFEVADMNWTTTEKDSFICTMAETLRWVGKTKAFTAPMIQAVRNTMERRTTKAAESAAHPVPAGRVVVTGEILSTKVVDNDYGVALKIVIKDDAGFRIYCSLPKAQADQAADEFYDGRDRYSYGSTVWFGGSVNEPEFTGVKGRRITFTATLEPSKDDQGFGFGSRPTKGAWL